MLFILDIQSKYRSLIVNQFCSINNDHLKWNNFPKIESKVNLKFNSNKHNYVTYAQISSKNGNFGFDDYPQTISNAEISWNGKDLKKLLTTLIAGDDLISTFQYKIRFFICNQIERFIYTKESSSLKLIPFGSDFSGIFT